MPDPVLDGVGRIHADGTLVGAGTCWPMIEAGMKIARLDTCDVSDTGRAIAKTIVELGQKPGMYVIAEGVETPGQARVSLSIGCREAQGFRFARPMAADAFATAIGDDPDALTHAHIRSHSRAP